MQIIRTYDSSSEHVYILVEVYASLVFGFRLAIIRSALSTFIIHFCGVCRGQATPSSISAVKLIGAAAHSVTEAIDGAHY
jgi:hypothetical protein